MSLRSISFAALCALGSGTVLAAESDRDAAARFVVQATLAPAPGETADGRYAVQATARLSGLDDQRYLVKSLAASCDVALSPDVFEDSFE